jgi:glucosylceramidase
MKLALVRTILTTANRRQERHVPSEHTRRTFLKIAAVGVPAGLAEFAGALPRKAVSAPESAISVRVTGGDLRYSAAPSVQWRTGQAGENTIRIEPEKKLQEMLGFGAAFTDAACYTFNRLSGAAREQLFHELFHPSQMRLNVCRTCIGASDYSTEVFSYDEGEPDPDMKRFSIAHDEAYVLPVMRDARRINPDLFLFSSPWSPPGWMKAGASMLGGSMRQHYFAPYAQYFLKFLQAYAAAGVPIQAVTVQNEVDTDQDGRMPACIWPQEYEIGFVKNHLGPVLEKSGLPTKIWILDHNYNLWGRAVAELDDPDLRKFCNSVAFHGYVGTPEMMSKVHEAYPEAELYWTEGGPDYTAPDYSTDWVTWGRTFTQAIQNWCRSVTGWNLALDEKGRPNIGPFPCGGLVTIHSQTKEITRSGQYWAFAHFSRNVERGAHRIDSRCSASGIYQVAFQNPNGEKVLVVTNPGEARTIHLSQGAEAAELSLASKSLTTVSWT